MYMSGAILPDPKLEQKWMSPPLPSYQHTLFPRTNPYRGFKRLPPAHIYILVNPLVTAARELLILWALDDIADNAVPGCLDFVAAS